MAFLVYPSAVLQLSGRLVTERNNIIWRTSILRFKNNYFPLVLCRRRFNYCNNRRKIHTYKIRLRRPHAYSSLLLLYTIFFDIICVKFDFNPPFSVCKIFTHTMSNRSIHCYSLFFDLTSLARSIIHNPTNENLIYKS